MVLYFVAVGLVISLLMPGSMLSAFDSPASTQRLAQLPVKQVLPTGTGRCMRFEQKERNRRPVNRLSHDIRNLAIVCRLT